MLAQDKAKQEQERLDELTVLFRKEPARFQAHLVGLLEELYELLDASLGGPRRA